MSDFSKQSMFSFDPEVQANIESLSNKIRQLSQSFSAPIFVYFNRINQADMKQMQSIFKILEEQNPGKIKWVSFFSNDQMGESQKLVKDVDYFIENCIQFKVLQELEEINMSQLKQSLIGSELH